jgi:hypothetical protein
MDNILEFEKQLTKDQEKVVYDDNYNCPKCGSKNILLDQCYEDNILCETSTICTNKDCGHKGYWAYGWYDQGL